MYPQAEYPYSQANYPDHGYGGEPRYVHEDYSDHGYGGEPSYVQEDYPDQGEGGEQDEECSYPITFSFDTNKKFSSRDELVDYVQKTGKDNDYVIVIKRSNKRGSNFKVWFQCSLGGEYKSVPTVKKTGSKKIGCPFELIGFTESKGGVWKIEVTNPRHNHTPIENLEGHALREGFLGG